MIARMIFLWLFLVLSAASGFAAEGSGTITGKWITKKYGPMTDAQVLLFNVATGPPPAGHRYLRTPNAGTSVGEDGTFLVLVPAGKYYLVMRKRLDPTSAGPPGEGDLQYYARHKDGKPKEFVVKAGRTTNVGTIAKATPYRKAKEKNADTVNITGIEGTVTDDQGRPMAGIRVFAYETAEMMSMPRYASKETGADGKFFLPIAQQGDYYLKARTHYGGGKPEEGELLGVYSPAGAPAPVTVGKGKTSRGIDIQVTGFTSKRK